MANPLVMDRARSNLTSRAFWVATLERMIRTFAQVLLAKLGLESVGIIHAKWSEGLSLAAGAALAALLTAVATSGTASGGPGLTEQPDPRVTGTAGGHPAPKP